MTNVVHYQPPTPSAPPGGSVLLPANLTEGMRFAELMAGSRLVPAHLQKSPADCMMVLMQAMRWRMDPFAVAQATAVIQGKLMYEGKLVAAVVNSLGQLTKRLGYAYSGDGDNRTVIVSGTLQGDPEPLTVSVRLKDARTNNKVWQTQPDQQLAYHGARVWARRYMPELMLGVYAPEEFDAPGMRDVTPAVPLVAAPPPPKPAARPIRVKVPGQPDVEFPQTDGLPAALGDALDFMSCAILDGGAGVVAANAALLDRIADRLPEMADAVAELRAAAVMAGEMADDAELADDRADDPDDFPGDLPPGTSSSLPPNH